MENGYRSLPLLTDVPEGWADNLLWGSEYPHQELTDFPDELDRLFQNPHLSDESRQKILWDTPARFLRSARGLSESKVNPKMIKEGYGEQSQR